MTWYFRFPSLFPPLNKDYVAWKIVNAVCTNQKFCIIPRSMYYATMLKWQVKSYAETFYDT